MMTSTKSMTEYFVKMLWGLKRGFGGKGGNLEREHMVRNVSFIPKPAPEHGLSRPSGAVLMN